MAYSGRVSQNKGKITIYWTNFVQAEDEAHGFSVSTYKVHTSIDAGETNSIESRLNNLQAPHSNAD